MEAILLRDEQRRAEARILPGFGLNCLELTFCTAAEPVHALWTPVGFEKGRQRGYLGGLPVLFPFPGRIRDGRFSFDGREYRVPKIDGTGNGLHGLVFDLPWEVLQSTNQRLEARICVCRGEREETRMGVWPAECELIIVYEIFSDRLACRFVVRNMDRFLPLPCGLGFHPYFRIPIGNGSSSACAVTLPAGCVWELDSRLIPTGKRMTASGLESLRTGQLFSDLDLDHVFGDLFFEDGGCTASIRDEGTGKTLWMKFSDIFRCCVVFTPPHRKSICMEPYTCLPDPFSLEERGMETGLRILAPGESFQGWMEIGVKDNA
jgi:aldose 1-epimerase